MPEALLAGLETPGLGYLMMASGLAGLVYGFAGFGAALIFLPIATQFVAPIVAVGSMSITALSSVFTVLPEALRRCHKRATVTILGAALLTTPLGLLVLRFADETLLRWVVSLAVALTLLLLIRGWRYKGQPGVPAWLGVGSAVGTVGGATGLNGPPLMLFQLGGSDGAAQMRANTMVVLTLHGLTMLPQMALQGAMPREAISLGLLLFVPYGAGAVIGRRLFDPARAGLYRQVAYGIIAAAALAGLPIYG